jgi:hypothetical protein
MRISRSDGSSCGAVSCFAPMVQYRDLLSGIHHSRDDRSAELTSGKLNLVSQNDYHESYDTYLYFSRICSPRR